MKDFVVMRDWTNPEIARAAATEFPDDSWEHWHRYDDSTALKFGTRDRLRIPPACLELLNQMNNISAGSLLGRDGLFPDFQYHAGGMHLIPPGGFLGTHIDAQRHPQCGWKREASAVLFLNEDWGDSGGELVLESSGKTIPVEFNKLAVFRSGVDTPHRVEQVTGQQCRKTLAVFFWSHRVPAGGHKSEFKHEN